MKNGANTFFYYKKIIQMIGVALKALYAYFSLITKTHFWWGGRGILMVETFRIFIFKGRVHIFCIFFFTFPIQWTSEVQEGICGCWNFSYRSPKMLPIIFGWRWVTFQTLMGEVLSTKAPARDLKILSNSGRLVHQVGE